MDPLILASRERFDNVRKLLRDAGYTTRAICDRLGVEVLDQYPMKAPLSEPVLAANSFELLLALFFEGGLVSRARLDSYLGANAFDDLTALGLIEPYSEDVCAPTVVLYPVNDIYICSDRFANFDGSHISARPDIVYPARSPETLAFLRAVPTTPCESLLDLCSGTGIFAFMQAPLAKHAYSFDIAGRSTHFAEFNRRLNGIDNVTCATGDLYEPAGDMTFDRIIAHPPYVPVLDDKLIYRDGGDDGENVLRRVVEGLPRHLRPGGRLYCSAGGSDRHEAPFENRIREWLGAAESDFDVAFVLRLSRAPQNHAISNLLRGLDDVAGLKQWKEVFHSKKINHLVYGTIVIQRHAEARPSFTLRRKMGPVFGNKQLEWLLDWETAVTQPGMSEAILTSSVRATGNAELHTKHVLEGGEWTPTAHSLEAAYPFESQAEVQGWAAVIVSAAKGQTGSELLKDLQREGVLHPKTPPVEFAKVLTVLLSGGFLESDGWPLPQR